jgi:hypothetical protein
VLWNVDSRVTFVVITRLTMLAGRSLALSHVAQPALPDRWAHAHVVPLECAAMTVKCPICHAQIFGTISWGDNLRCPGCRELLRVQSPTRSKPVRVIVIGAIVAGMIWQLYSGWVGILLILISPIVMTIIEVVVALFLGVTLEPAGEAGRLPLGESTDD